MSLDARLGVRLGSLSLSCDFDALAGHTTALLGPNGAGKTTVLRVLAGLLRLDQGAVVLDGEKLEETDGGKWVAPERRRVGLMFQDHALFPHLSVLDNVGFGLRARGASRRASRRRAGEWLDRFGLSAHASSPPRTLSGGEAQRVALARVLVTEPRLLLLDEPLAAADASAKIDLRRTLREHLAGFEGVRLLVTHDPVEAASLADRVVIIEEGRIVQTGSFAEVTARPRSWWVARMAGLNLLDGVVRAGTLTLAGGSQLAVAAQLSGPALATIHPRAVALYRRPPSGSPRNVLRCSVAGVDAEGDRWRIRLDGPVPLVAEVTPAAAAELLLSEGGVVYAVVKATEIDVYDV